MSYEHEQDPFEAVLRPLWLRAHAGDDVAYREALSRIATRVRTFLRRRMQSTPDDIEDVVQETLLAIHLQRATFDATLPVSSWVHAIARHKLIDLWRRRGRRESLHDSLDEMDDASHPVAEQEGLAHRDLAKLLQQVTLAQRNAIVLIKIEGLSVAEASARTGVSVSALKVQVHRGLKRLTVIVKGEG